MRACVRECVCVCVCVSVVVWCVVLGRMEGVHVCACVCIICLQCLLPLHEGVDYHYICCVLIAACLTNFPKRTINLYSVGPWFTVVKLKTSIDICQLRSCVRGGRPGLSVLDGPYGLCGHAATLHE